MDLTTDSSDFAPSTGKSDGLFMKKRAESIPRAAFCEDFIDESLESRIETIHSDTTIALNPIKTRKARAAKSSKNLRNGPSLAPSYNPSSLSMYNVRSLGGAVPVGYPASEPLPSSFRHFNAAPSILPYTSGAPWNVVPQTLLLEQGVANETARTFTEERSRDEELADREIDMFAHIIDFRLTSNEGEPESYLVQRMCKRVSISDLLKAGDCISEIIEQPRVARTIDAKHRQSRKVRDRDGGTDKEQGQHHGGIQEESSSQAQTRRARNRQRSHDPSSASQRPDYMWPQVAPPYVPYPYSLSQGYFPSLPVPIPQPVTLASPPPPSPPPPPPPPIPSASIDEDSFHRLRALTLDGQVSEKRLERMEGLLEEREAQWAQSTKDKEAEMMVAMKKALKEKQAAEDMAERTKIAAKEATRALEKAAAEMMAEVEHAATEAREEARKAAVQIRDEAEVAAAVAESKRAVSVIGTNQILDMNVAAWVTMALEAREEIKAKPITFEDCIGRKYAFSFRICKKWPAMEELIQSAFRNVPKLLPFVQEGWYDVMSPEGDILLPEAWEYTIEPGWTVSQRLWPVPDFVLESLPKVAMAEPPLQRTRPPPLISLMSLEHEALQYLTNWSSDSPVSLNSPVSSFSMSYVRRRQRARHYWRVTRKVKRVLFKHCQPLNSKITRSGGMERDDSDGSWCSDTSQSYEECIMSSLPDSLHPDTQLSENLYSKVPISPAYEVVEPAEKKFNYQTPMLPESKANATSEMTAAEEPKNTRESTPPLLNSPSWDAAAAKDLSQHVERDLAIASHGDINYRPPYATSIFEDDKEDDTESVRSIIRGEEDSLTISDVGGVGGVGSNSNSELHLPDVDEEEPSWDYVYYQATIGLSECTNQSQEDTGPATTEKQSQGKELPPQRQASFISTTKNEPVRNRSDTQSQQSRQGERGDEGTEGDESQIIATNTVNASSSTALVLYDAGLTLWEPVNLTSKELAQDEPTIELDPPKRRPTFPEEAGLRKTDILPTDNQTHPPGWKPIKTRNTVSWKGHTAEDKILQQTPLTETKRDGITELNSENLAEGRAQAKKEAALRQDVQKKIEDTENARKQLTAVRWIHIPANNMRWVEIVLQKVCKENEVDIHDVLADRHWKDCQYISGRNAPHARFMKPEGGWVGDRNMFLFMPYLHWDSYDNHESRTAAMHTKQDYCPLNASSEIKLIYHYFNPKSSSEELHGPTYLHPRRSLDQSYYLQLENTDDRDQDQVLSRYFQNKKEKAKIMMVDQLWLWIIDDNTIITSFPECASSEYGPSSNVYSSIIHSLEDASSDPPRPTSAYDLALHIVDHATGFFQKLELHTGLRFIDVYEEEIITLENRATLSLRNFKDGLKLQDDGDNSIYQDIDILFLVSDALDELKIIHRILLTQLEAISLLIKTLDESSRRRDRNPEWIYHPQGFLTRNEDYIDKSPEILAKWKKFHASFTHISQILALIESAESMLSHHQPILDLRQKQANIAEAEASRRQAEDAVQQGKTILLFTVVTIIFLPLSFMASIFGMNAIEINGSPTGSSFHLGTIFAYMFPLSSAVTGLALFIGFRHTMTNMISRLPKLLGRQELKSTDASMTVPDLPRQETLRDKMLGPLHAPLGGIITRRRSTVKKDVELGNL